jgi:hypothetical protein
MEKAVDVENVLINRQQSNNNMLMMSATTQSMLNSVSGAAINKQPSLSGAPSNTLDIMHNEHLIQLAT